MLFFSNRTVTAALLSPEGSHLFRARKVQALTTMSGMERLMTEFPYEPFAGLKGPLPSATSKLLPVDVRAAGTHRPTTELF